LLGLPTVTRHIGFTLDRHASTQNSALASRQPSGH
jgi:hypothetical protein